MKRRVQLRPVTFIIQQAGNVHRTKLAGVFAQHVELGEINLRCIHLNTLLSERRGGQMWLEIKETADPHHPHALGSDGGDRHLFRAKPGGAQGAERRDALMVLLGVTLHACAAGGEQVFGFAGKAGHILCARQAVGMFRRQIGER